MASGNANGQMGVKELQDFLRRRGVVYSGVKRAGLVELYSLAKQLKIEVDPDGLYEDRSHILERKLKVLGGQFLPNPSCLPCQRNLSILPRISIFDIYNYLLTFSQDYTHTKLKNYKKLDGYNLFLDGFVVDLLCGQFPTPFDKFFAIQSKVKPKTRESDPVSKLPFYKSWVILNGDADSCCVKSAFCCCKGGADGCCRHVVATLFELDEFLNNNGPSTTSGRCQWTPRVQKHDLAMEATEICTGITRNVGACAGVPFVGKLPDIKHLISTVRLHKPDACLLKAFDLPSKDIDKIRHEFSSPTSSQKYRNFFSRHASCICSENCYFTLIQELSYTNDEVNAIEAATRGQIKNELWKAFHQCLITSSNFHTVVNSRDPVKTAKKLLESRIDDLHVPAVVFGREHESRAREMFVMEHSTFHDGVASRDTGIFLGKYPNTFVGASPDGILNCGTCGKSLIEIKCLWKHQNLNPRDALLESKLCYESNDGQLHLLRNHRYFTQIQGQMLVTDIRICHLVAFTRAGIHCVKVHMDSAFCETLLDKISKFHREAFFKVARHCFQAE